MADSPLIVCATRGGQGSRAAQFQAIRIARERQARLAFLYIVDIHSLGAVDEKLVAAVHAELQWLGKAMLQVARQRAQQLGLDVDVAIREGTVREAMITYLRESQASLLLLGAPRGTSDQFGDDAIEKFARSIEEETGVPVLVVRPEVVS
jgi:nucleotide-binding universal stress UspA family protein